VWARTITSRHEKCHLSILTGSSNSIPGLNSLLLFEEEGGDYMLVRTRLHAARKFSILFLLTFLFLLTYLAAVMLPKPRVDKPF